MRSPSLLIGLLVFCLISSQAVYAQTISLTNLLEFQEEGSHANITLFLNNQWTVSSESGNYRWINASANESYPPNSRDEVALNAPQGLSGKVLIYMTTAQANYDSLFAALQNTMTANGTLINTEQVVMHKFSTANNVVEVIKPLIVPEGQVLRYTFIVYASEDY